MGGFKKGETIISPANSRDAIIMGKLVLRPPATVNTIKNTFAVWYTGSHP